MPLIAYTPPAQEVPVNDRTWQNTTVKQKARPTKLLIDQSNPEAIWAQLHVEVIMYSDNNGAYGDELTGNGISRYPVVLVADNNSAVSPTGELAYILVTPSTALNCLTNAGEAFEPGDNWNAFLEKKPETLILQGNFFALLRDTQDVRIADLQRNNILQGAVMGKYA